MTPAAQARLDRMLYLVDLEPAEAAGHELREQRLLAGLSLGQAAAALACSRELLDAIERSLFRPPSDLAGRMATVYGCGGVSAERR